MNITNVGKFSGKYKKLQNFKTPYQNLKFCSDSDSTLKFASNDGRFLNFRRGGNTLKRKKSFNKNTQSKQQFKEQNALLTHKGGNYWLIGGERAPLGERGGKLKLMFPDVAHFFCE